MRNQSSFLLLWQAGRLTICLRRYQLNASKEVLSGPNRLFDPNQNCHVPIQKAGDTYVLIFCSDVIISPLASITSSTQSFNVSTLASSFATKDSFPTARVLFDFTPTSEFELKVSGEKRSPVGCNWSWCENDVEGEMVHVVENDDGSGWVKVVNMQQRDGLVPVSYLEHGANQTLATQGGSSQHGMF